MKIFTQPKMQSLLSTITKKKLVLASLPASAYGLAKLSLILACILPIPVGSFANDPIVFDRNQFTEKLIEKALQEKVYDEIGWHRRIFYFDGRFLGKKGLFDDKEFYFSPKGKRDSKAELIASIKAFIGEDLIQVKDKKDHPRCLFPARWHWLSQRLNLKDSELPEQSCPDIDRFLKYTQYSSVSLIFTNYFINSPASIFGHTFLRLEREATSGIQQGGLLDDAANFSAMVPVFNPLTYPFQGLFGFFEGRFAIVPYFQKVQEYNNYEQRDIWEYHLDLTQEEVLDLTLLLFEVGLFVIDYYYLNDNCSFIILTLLDAIRPELSVSHPFTLYAIPADTLRSVAKVESLVSKVSYRPSAFSRYIGRLGTLTTTETKNLIGMVKRAEDQSDETIDFSQDCNQVCQAKVLDTLIEYIDFSEKLVGSAPPVNFKKLRTSALMLRAKNQQKPDPLDYHPENERPDFGHDSSALGFQIGVVSGGEGSYRFQWKPALHDLFAKSVGYSDQIQISFLDTNLSYYQETKKLFVDEIRYIELLSLPKAYPLYNPWSWRFVLASDSQYYDLESKVFFTKHFLSFGMGKNIRMFSDRLLAYALANVEVGRATENFTGWYTGLVPELGLLLKLSDSWQVNGLYKHHFLNGETQGQSYEQGQLRITYFLDKNAEIFSSNVFESKEFFSHLGYRLYY